MRIHLIKAKTIRELAEKHASSLKSFEIWIDLIKSADWSVPEDMKRTFRSADFLGNGSNRVVFNIGGNNYRIICKYQFSESIIHLFVTWIGTHAEYTKLCNQGAQYTIEKF